MLWLLYHHTGKELHELQNKSCWNSRENIFLIDSENVLLNKQVEWQNDTRVHAWVPCVFDLERANLYHFWFDWMQEIEQNLNLYSKLENQLSKPYFFDALLGTTRHHKDIVNDLIDNSKNKEQFMISYNGNPHFGSSPELWIPGTDDDVPGQYIMYNKIQEANPACVIPYRIYNQCWYSLVAETSGSQPNFYTEKTGKPLLSKRVFVMFAGQHHLKHLRESGFRTFNEIINEDYDNEPDLKTRYKMAWQQVEFLLTQDPMDMYNRAKDILDHNYIHFMNTNWKHEMHKKIQNISH